MLRSWGSLLSLIQLGFLWLVEALITLPEWPGTCEEPGFAHLESFFGT